MPGANPLFNLPFMLAGLGEGSRGYVQGMQAEDEHEKNQAMLQALVKRSQFESQTQPMQLQEMSDRARIGSVQAREAEESEQPVEEPQRHMMNAMLRQIGVATDDNPEPIAQGTKKKDAEKMFSTMGSFQRPVSAARLKQMELDAAQRRVETQQSGANSRQQTALKSSHRQNLAKNVLSWRSQMDMIEKSYQAKDAAGNDTPAYSSAKLQYNNANADLADFDKQNSGQQGSLGEPDETGVLPDPFGANP